MTKEQSECPTLASLLHELQAAIFEQLEGLETIISLARTSKHFLAVYHDNQSRIIQRVIENTVTCYDDAMRVCDAHAFLKNHAPVYGEPGVKMLHLNHGDGPLNDHQRQIYRRYDAAAQRACNHFLSYAIGCDMEAGHCKAGDSSTGDDGIVRPQRNPAYLTKSERERFIHAYYCVREYLIYERVADPLQREQQRHALIDAGIEEWWRYSEIAYFYLLHSVPQERRAFFPDLYDGWNMKVMSQICEIFRRKLRAAGHTGMIPRHPGCPRELYIAVFDEHQETLRQMAEDIYSGKRKDD